MIVNGQVMTKRTVLKEGVNGARNTIRLVHHTAGWECAGAGTRTVPDCFRVEYTMNDGSRGSFQFHNMENAEEKYERMVSFMM